MYEISKEVIELSPSAGVDQLCELLYELYATGRPIAQLLVVPGKVEVDWMVDPEQEMLDVVGGRPSSIESMLQSIKIQELVSDEVDAFRMTYVMCKTLSGWNASPICWVVGDLEHLKRGIEICGASFDEVTGASNLYGVPVRVSAELGEDRLVLVGGGSRHHSPAQATLGVAAVMQWAVKEDEGA